MSKPQMRLSIVLPCYNEARNLPLLLKRYRESWEDLPSELILVENGSSDDSAAVLKHLLASGDYDFARVVSVPRNRGYGYGVMAGIRSAAGEFVAFSHADMQCAAADVFAAYRKLAGTEDPQSVLVKGRRQGRLWRDRAVTTVMSLMASVLLRSGLTDINAQPKVFHRSLVERLANPPDGFQLDLYVLRQAVRAGMQLETVPVVFPPRIHGESNWAFSLASRWRMIRQTIQYMFRLSLGFDR